MRIDTAPLQKAIFGGQLLTAQGWVQWFSAIGSALKGEWGRQSPRLTYTGVATALSAIFDYKGVSVDVYLRWSDGTDLGGGTITLPQQVIKMRLPVYDSTGLLGVALAENNTITLPSATASGECFLAGHLLLKQSGD